MLQREMSSPTGDYSEISKRIDKDYLSCRGEWESYWRESNIDVRLESGDISLMGELGGAPVANGRPNWFFNHVRPLLNMVSGTQRSQRKSSIVLPLENADQATADQLTKIILQIYKRENVYELLSDAFHQGACMTGLNLLQVYMDWRNDPVNGEIKVNNLPYNAFFMDPYWRKSDLSDCQFVWLRHWITYAEALSLLPHDAEALKTSNSGTPNRDSRDVRFQYLPEVFGMPKRNRIAYDEYYYRDYRKQILLVDKLSGETLDVTFKEEMDRERFLAENPGVYENAQYIPTVRMAILVNDKVVHDGPQPLGIDVLPFVPVMGYFNSMMPAFSAKIQGICRSLRDPQILLNRRIMLNSELLESTVNSGWIFKEEAILDVKHLFQTGPGRNIPIKRGSQITDIVQIQPPNVPPSHFEMEKTYTEEISRCTGINSENLGMAIDDKAGILAVLRSRAGLTALQPIFDKLDSAQNMLGNIFIMAVQANYTPGKVRILLEGEEPAPLFYNKSFGKYHCAVEQGFNTETQKQMQFAQFVQLQELGIKIPAKAMINAAMIQDKTKLMEEIERLEQQEAQMAQQQIQAQVQETQARTELAQARSIADRGLGVERVSRVNENEQLAEERKAQAHKEDTEALLAFARAMKEIEGLDFVHLEKLMSMKKMLKEVEQIGKEPKQVKPVKKSMTPKPVRKV